MEKQWGFSSKKKKVFTAYWIWVGVSEGKKTSYFIFQSISTRFFNVQISFQFLNVKKFGFEFKEIKSIVYFIYELKESKLAKLISRKI